MGNGTDKAPYRMWAATTTFRKEGTPVMGTMGSRAARVVVMSTETFKRLVAENPDLATATFELMDMDA